MTEPLAYAAVAADGSEAVYVASLKEQAEAFCRENGWTLVQLYAAPPEVWQLVHEIERLRDEVLVLRRPATWQDEQAAVEAAFERSGVKRTWPDDEPDQIIPMVNAMANEIERLREAIRRLAEQDATLSVVGGNVIVEMDATLTPEERDAVETAALEADAHQHTQRADTLRGLLERLQ